MTKAWAILSCAASAALLILGTALVLRKHPEGKYDGYVLFSHDQADTVIFEGGSVVYSTCCGKSSWGTYTVDKGVLYWHWQRSRLFKTVDAVVVPGFFGATVKLDVDGKHYELWIRRKLTESTRI